MGQDRMRTGWSFHFPVDNGFTIPKFVPDISFAINRLFQFPYRIMNIFLLVYEGVPGIIA
jgi:hypothetical protein